ncbi:MAG: helix-turn-helix domain-containing protein [Pirellula sp.]
MDRHHGDSIHSIAQRTGFAHPEYMTAAFKKSHGIAPTEYRESFIGKSWQT